MLSHAILWDQWGLGVLIPADSVSRLKWKSPVDTSVQTEWVSEWGWGRLWEAAFPTECLGLSLGQDGAHSEAARGRSQLLSAVAQGRLWDLLAIDKGFAKESWVYK